MPRIALLLLRVSAALGLQAASTPRPERTALLSVCQQAVQASALFSTSAAESRRVSEACDALERVAAVDRAGFPRDLMLVDGRWRCIFTSAGASFLPEPVMRLIGVSPLSGLQPTGVEQVIDVMGRRVVNCVDLAPWPKGPIGGFLANAPGPLGGTLGALRDATVSLELDHAFSVPGDGSDGGRRQTAASATINLRLEEVRRTLGSVGENPVASLIPRESTYKIPGVVSGVAGVGSFDTTCAAPLLPALLCSARLTHAPICFATKPGTWTRRSASRAAAGRATSFACSSA